MIHQDKKITVFLISKLFLLSSALSFFILFSSIAYATPSTKELLSQLKNKDWKKQLSALEELSKRATTSETLNAYFHALTSPKEKIQIVAKNAIQKTKFDSERFVPIVLKAAKSKQIIVSSNALDFTKRLTFNAPKITNYLVEFLKASDESRRILGLYLLGYIGVHAKKAIPSIKGILFKENHPVQIAATISLCQIDKKVAKFSEAIELMIQFLKSPTTSRDMKQEAIKALGICEEVANPAIPVLFQALRGQINTKSNNKYQKNQPSNIVIPPGLIGTPKGIPPQAPIIQPTSKPISSSQYSSQPSSRPTMPKQLKKRPFAETTYIQIEAMHSLSKIIKKPKTFEKFAKILISLARQKKILLYHNIIETFAKIHKHTKLAIPFLIQQLDKSNSQYVQKILSTIKTKDPKISEILIKLYKKAPQTKKINILTMFGDFAPKTIRTRNFLLHLLDKKNSLSKLIVISMLSNFPDKKSFIFNRFVKLLQQKKFPYKGQLIEALSRKKQKALKILPLLIKTFKNLPPDIRIMTILVIEELAPHHPQIIKEKCNMLLHKSANIRKSGEIGLKKEGERAFPIFFEIFKQKDKKLSIKIIQFLGSLGGKAKKALPELRKILKNKEKNLREASQKAIQKIENSKK